MQFHGQYQHIRTYWNDSGYGIWRNGQSQGCHGYTGINSVHCNLRWKFIDPCAAGQGRVF